MYLSFQLSERGANLMHARQLELKAQAVFKRHLCGAGDAALAT